MKTAIMQPYFFPYVGYFELIKYVDNFVFLSNVQYVKRRWINRNKIRSANKNFQYITIPIKNCQQKTLIENIEINYSTNWIQDQLKTLLHTYGKKIKNNLVYVNYEKYLYEKENKLDVFNKFCIKQICYYFKFETNFFDSNKFKNDLDKTKRILNICKSLNTSEYVNATNGQTLYQQKDFIDMKLTFMEPTKYENKLSILDLLFGDNITSI
jgi:hypothetical protein